MNHFHPLDLEHAVRLKKIGTKTLIIHEPELRWHLGTHGRYTKEFREEAPFLRLEDGLSACEAARRLSFWGTLKTELTFHRHYQTRQETKRDIQKYIELFYYRQRK